MQWRTQAPPQTQTHSTQSTCHHHELGRGVLKQQRLGMPWPLPLPLGLQLAARSAAWLCPLAELQRPAPGYFQDLSAYPRADPFCVYHVPA
jgi:hypothetical protein